MPPALHRLLASPFALQLLRSIVNDSHVPTTCSTTTFCSHAKPMRRTHTTDRPNVGYRKWRRWKEATQSISKRDKVRQLLEGDSHLSACELNTDSLLQDTTLGEGVKSGASIWAKTLFRRERLHGQQGIKEIWSLRRHARFDLPIDDTTDARYLWGTFVKHPELVKHVIDHATELLKKNAKLYPHLYDLVMSYWLPRDVDKALDYHHSMLVKLKLKALPLKKLMNHGQSKFKPKTYEAMMEIYRASNERNLYDEVVLPLIEKGNITMARRWHNLCTFRNDMPTDSAITHPIVHIFTADSSTMSPPKTTSNESMRDNPRYNQELLRRFLGRDSAPVRFEDSFCAKMFATNTFSLESIINGLAMVGVNEIGPQAVQALAFRTQPLEDLSKSFEELKAAGISLQGSVYSLSLEKFAMEHRWQLVRSMLDSDQHPDVFGDIEVQRKLLSFYLNQGDRRQVQLTLAVLTLFHNDSSKESWNLLLQTHIKETGPKHVTEVLQDMRIRGIMVTTESIAAIKTLLRHRQQGRQPVKLNRGTFDDLRFTTRIFVTILEFGMGPISPLTWRELIRRFGMSGRLRELQRLLLWLLCWYAPRSSAQFAKLPMSPYRNPAFNKLRKAYPERNHYFHFPRMVMQHENRLHPVRQLFAPSLLQALIIWGFRAGLLPYANLEQSRFGSVLQKKHYRRRLLNQQILQRLSWSFGLRLVVQLRDLGVHVHHHTVVKALQMQLIVLFGHGRSNVTGNRIMENTNTIPYTRYIQEINNIWGTPLFGQPHDLEKGRVRSQPWHPRMRRRVRRKTSISFDELLGVGWQDPDKQTDEIEQPTAEQHGNRALKELERSFQAQGKSLNQGPEWMHEASFNTKGSTFRGD
ncbi:hypothetical protein GQ44DRAFT_707077 [Phaeosphaeriaceae sp. PMI808]|nr:hypothetical protein GQ44DRAFT_707077 [Phaeosphaeriaceae sp. PMI808]